MIIKKEQLLQHASDLELVDASINSNLEISLKMSILDFIQFCKDKDVKTVFCDYRFYKKDYYLITDEIINKYTHNKNERAFCKKWANEVNARLNDQDFSRPYSLELVCAIGSLTIGCAEYDEWIPKDSPSGEIAFMHFLEEHEDELDALYEGDHEEELSLYDELVQVLLSDPAFRFSTTLSSRKQYVREFLYKKDNKKYLGLVRKAIAQWEKEDQFRDIVNRLYEQYRNRCRSLKLHVGDPLPEENDEE